MHPLRSDGRLASRSKDSLKTADKSLFFITFSVSASLLTVGARENSNFLLVYATQMGTYFLGEGYAIS